MEGIGGITTKRVVMIEDKRAMGGNANKNGKPS
jgi:hypothetical protein